MTEDVVRATGAERTALLKKMRDRKGAEYTDALVSVIARLDADGRRTAREALADRLTRMKATTLREYLKDEAVEIRRAAALAVAQKEASSLIPDLIRLLSDPESLVERAAHAEALKSLSGKRFSAHAPERIAWSGPRRLPPGKCGGRCRHASESRESGAGFLFQPQRSMKNTKSCQALHLDDRQGPRYVMRLVDASGSRQRERLFHPVRGSHTRSSDVASGPAALDSAMRLALWADLFGWEGILSAALLLSLVAGMLLAAWLWPYLALRLGARILTHTLLWRRVTGRHLVPPARAGASVGLHPDELSRLAGCPGGLPAPASVRGPGRLDAPGHAGSASALERRHHSRRVGPGGPGASARSGRRGSGPRRSSVPFRRGMPDAGGQALLTYQPRFMSG